MKFIHTSDVHLGAVPDAGKPWARQRATELWDSFSDICAACSRERADLLLIAGNLFDRQPLKKEIKEAAYLLGSLDRTQVVMIAGDADYLRGHDGYSSYPWPKNVHFLKSGSMDRVYFNFLDTEVCGMSYDRAQITEPLYDNLSVQLGETYHILLGHGGDANHIPINRTRLATAGFDYVALGHSGRCEIHEREKCAYSGSPEPLDKKDDGVHGYILGEITGEGTKIRLIPSAKRSYKNLVIRTDTHSTTQSVMEELRGLLAHQGMQNIFCVKLLGSSAGSIDCQALMTAGSIMDVETVCSPEYDLEKLKREHKGDIIEKYINIFDHKEGSEEEKRALDYGLRALLGGLE